MSSSDLPPANPAPGSPPSDDPASDSDSDASFSSTEQLRPRPVRPPGAPYTPAEQALVDSINLATWGTTDPVECKRLYVANGNKLPDNHPLYTTQNSPPPSDGTLVKVVLEATKGVDGAEWGFLGYRVRSPGEGSREQERWDRWRSTFDGNIAVQLNRVQGGGKVSGGLRFEWVELQAGEEDAVVAARSHFRNLVSTSSSLAAHLTTELFILVDSASIASLIDPRPRPAAETEAGPSHKRPRTEPHRSYVVVVDPDYPGEPGTSYEGEELGYDGTLKVNTKLLLSEFWPAVSSYGAAQGLDEVAIHTFGKDGRRRVYNGSV